MFIIVNKDFSIAKIVPSTVYQGSNNANELAIFAPFSVSSYAVVEVAVMLPSGEYLDPPLPAFPTETQTNGIGAWSVLLPSTVTAEPGTVKFSMTFFGAKSKMVTEAAEITVQASVPTPPPTEPDEEIYEKIYQSLSSILQRHPDWNQGDPTQPDYISNKPPIEATKNNAGELVGAKVSGQIEVTGAINAGIANVIGAINAGSANVTGAINARQISATTMSMTTGTVQGVNINNPSEIVNVQALFGVLNNLSGAKLSYNANNGVISLLNGNDETISTIDLPLESTVSGAEYNEATQKLVITFTNGSTAYIPLADLILPDWVTNLDTIPSGSGTVPPTADAVKNYAVPIKTNNSAIPRVYAVTNGRQTTLEVNNPLLPPNSGGEGYIAGYRPTGQLLCEPPINPKEAVNLEFLNQNAASALSLSKTGKGILIDDLSPLFRTITFSSVGTYKMYNSNLADIGNASAAAGEVGYENNEATDYDTIEWKNGRFFVLIPVNIPAGVECSFAFDWASTVAERGNVRFVYNGDINDTSGTISVTTENNRHFGTSTPTKNVTALQISKNSSSDSFTGSVLISNLCVTLGNTAVCERYKTPVDVTVTSTQKTYTPPTNYGVVTFISTNSNISLKYNADPVKVIDRLNQRIAALEKAIAT